MMLTVHKYPVTPGEFTLRMPQQAQLLSVQIQNGKPVLWALVDPDSRKIDQQFVAVGTGMPIATPDRARDLTFVGTFQFTEGIETGLVFHLFRR